MTVRHRMHNSPEYFSWSSMKTRCLNPNCNAYKNYGGRGITICEQWINSFSAFLADMGPRPEGFSLDRVDSNGNYEPGNCRWASRKQQNRNTSRSIKATVNGETRSLRDIADQAGVSPGLLYSRFSQHPEKVDQIASMALENPKVKLVRKIGFKSNALDPSNFIGKVFGRLTLVAFHSFSKRGLVFSCICSCGNEKIACLSYMARGETTSCGCFMRESASLRQRLRYKPTEAPNGTL